MKIDQLNTFVSVVDHQSFSGAAKALNISAAAVSQKISALEEHYKVSLLIRSTQGVEFTDLGSQVYNNAVKILQSINETKNLILESKATPTGDLHIVAPIGRYIPQYISEFIKTHPQISLTLDLSERCPDFQKEKIDLLLGADSEAAAFLPPNIVRKRISAATYILCASPKYLAQHGFPKKPQDLAQHAYIAHLARPLRHIVNFANNISVEVKPIVAMTDTSTMARLAVDGVGIVKLHRYMVHEELKRGELVEVLADHQVAPFHLALFYPYSKNIKPALRCFIDFMVNRVDLDL